MDIQVARFREVLGLLKPVVPRKSSLPILTNVLLKDGQAMATDLETMVILPVPEADVSCLIPYTDVVKLLQYIQGGEYLHIEAEGGRVTLTWSEGKSSFVSKDVGEFPAIPEFVPTVEAPFDSDTLIPAMVSVLPYASTDTARPVLNGVTLVMGEPIEVAAGDAFRMAYQVLPLSFPENITIVVPASSVTALRHLWEKTPRTPPLSSDVDSLIPVLMAKKETVVSYDGKTGLRFSFGQSATAIIKLVEGSPPAWLKLIPKEEPVLQSQVMASQLELAVRRLRGIAKEGSNIIRMEFNEDSAVISAKGGDQEAESTIKTFDTKGFPAAVGINASYLLDYLNGKEGIVSIAWTGNDAPVVFQHQRNPKVIIMPMHIAEKASAEPAEEPPAEPAEGPPAEPTEEAPTVDAEQAPAEVPPAQEAAPAAKSPQPKKKRR